MQEDLTQGELIIEELKEKYEYLVILYYFHTGSSLRSIGKKFKRSIKEIEEIIRVSGDAVTKYKPLHRV